MSLVIVPARSGTGFVMAAGQRLRIVDVEGGQTGDLVVYRRDTPTEHLFNGRTFDYAGKLALGTGDVLWSNLSNPMLTILDDQVGHHDFLYGACTIEMYRKQYGVTGEAHQNRLRTSRSQSSSAATAAGGGSTGSRDAAMSPSIAWIAAVSRVRHALT
jgi:uncharacterized protein YcgI (DUF1989 family)